MADIFISYSSKDREKANLLVEYLSGLGYSVWIDRSGIDGAQIWTEEIVAAINSCNTLIILLSESSIGSHNVTKELHLAIEKKKHILPIVIHEVALPPAFEYPLAGLQRLGFSDHSSILRSLERLLHRNTLVEDIHIRQVVSVAHDPSKKRDRIEPRLIPLIERAKRTRVAHPRKMDQNPEIMFVLHYPHRANIQRKPGNGTSEFM